MTEQELAEIEARANAATAGPWVAHIETFDEPTVMAPNVPGPYGEPQYICQTIYDMQSMTYRAWDDGAHISDAVFIAHVRTDVPTLIEEVRRLRALVTP